LSPQQRAQLQGEHVRRHHPEPGRVYIAAIDLAGEAEEGEGAYLRAVKPRRDSTVVTIGELDFSINDVQRQPGVKIVEHYWCILIPYLAWPGYVGGYTSPL